MCPLRARRFPQASRMPEMVTPIPSRPSTAARASPAESDGLQPAHPIRVGRLHLVAAAADRDQTHLVREAREDRKSTRLNSSHANISYAVFCLKKTTNIFLALSE